MPVGRGVAYGTKSEKTLAVAILHPASYDTVINPSFTLPYVSFGEKEDFFMQKRKSAVFKSVNALTLAAMLTAMSVVIGIFCKNFLDFGGGLFRVTFENLPIVLSGILFGPLAGAIVGAATDLISYLLSSQVYPPNLIVTLGAATVGAVSGTVALIMKKSPVTLKIAAAGAAAHIVGSMIIKPIGLYQFYGIMVLWRVPMYLVIAPIEIFILCMLFKNSHMRKLFGSVSRLSLRKTEGEEDKNDL